MSCYKFGQELLRTNDLDPVYVALWYADLPRPTLLRWLLAYWCFYHAGTASWAASAEEEDNYWRRMATAAGSKAYPRGPERRHFRGKAAVKAVASLQTVGVSKLFHPLLARPTANLSDVLAVVRGWYLFGSWIAFKAADMLERLDLCAVNFNTANAAVYESPRSGAEDLWTAEKGEASPPAQGVVIWAVARIIQEIKGYKAPPRYERPLNIQEAETILCKWHSYLKGHYEVGEDVKALQTGLVRFPCCGLTQNLLRAGVVGGLWL